MIRRVVTVGVVVALIVSGSVAFAFRENLAPLEVHQPVHLNPTSYEFLVPADDVVQTIVAAFSEARPVVSSLYRSLPLQSSAPIPMNVVYSAETRESSLFGKETFARAGDKTDVYLHSFGEPILSSVYCVLGRRLPYRVEFAIRVQAVGEGSQVSVEALNPRVLKGIGGFGPHGTYSAEVPVRPTTIEEYSLLLYIGDALGAPPMPDVLTGSDSCA
jgi:hypothetical protein